MGCLGEGNTGMGKYKKKRPGLVQQAELVD